LASETQWVAVDWGTSNVRAWGIAADGSQTFSAEADKGMGRIARADYPAVLGELIAGRYAEGTIIVCGMAGARQGWVEAPYRETPADLYTLSAGAVSPPDSRKGYDVHILPGVCQRAAGREDVMRGEETQLLGLLHLRPGFSGTAILPGTHSKWAEIREGRIVRFSSVMTGELYEVLSEHSVLRHSLGVERMGPATEDGIAEGMAAGLAHPELLTALAFRTRAAGLLSGKGPDWCSGYLSGLLVGTEIASHRDWLDGDAVPLIGSARLARLYGAALNQLGVQGFAIEAADATIAGLKEARGQS
jgi:2-dehydro-3-deoxygalactonokinase